MSSRIKWWIKWPESGCKLALKCLSFPHKCISKPYTCSGTTKFWSKNRRFWPIFGFAREASEISTAPEYSTGPKIIFLKNLSLQDHFALRISSIALKLASLTRKVRGEKKGCFFPPWKSQYQIPPVWSRRDDRWFFVKNYDFTERFISSTNAENFKTKSDKLKILNLYKVRYINL